MAKPVYGPATIEMHGHVTVELFGPDGKLKDRRTGHNVITTVGKEFLASFLYSSVAAAATNTARYIAIGTDATGEAVGNTALGIETSRHTGTVSYVSGGIFRVIATFATGSGTGAIVEYGLLSSNTAGTLVGRHTSAAVNKGSSDTLTVTYDVTFS
jgi:hypothetical protein